MPAITAAMVKELRDRTAAGMMDSKNALTEAGGNMEAAIDWLRQKGLSKAAKKAGRATSEGLVASAVAADNSKAAIVEVMCETDFVSRGDSFRAFAKSVGQTVFDKNPADAEALLALTGNEVNDRIATLGENISLGRFAVYAVTGSGVIGCYVHANGKIGVLVDVVCGKAETAKQPALQELARNIAMQIAAASPVAVDASSLDPALVEREREVFRQKTLEEGKPANIVEKIVEGRIQKFYQEVCLVNQAYIRDDSKSIQALLQEQGKALGDALSVKRFIRLQLGEGLSE
ncbi:MAG: translation elongation factor Ts [Deltaproteobacteria bacterium]|jgi:elongation factor Ts|nr:translation elongation factor Ts [Deltaproteobacteria bacterium]